MKSLKFLLFILLPTVMLLTACGPVQIVTDVPGDEPGGPFTDTETITGTNPIIGSEPVTGTDLIEPSPAVTPPEERTDPPPTESMEATEAMTITEVLPPTGFVDPNRITNLLDFSVYNQNNEPIGQVSNLIISAETQKVDYVLLQLGDVLGLEANANLIPVPWGVLEVVGSRDRPEAGSNENAGDLEEIQNAFVLAVDQTLVEDAPAIDLTAFPALGESAEGWEAEFQSYWANILPPIEGNAPVPNGNLQGVLLATDLIGNEISLGDDTGEAELTGTLDDGMLDTVTGQVRFLVVSFVFEEGPRRLPIPLEFLGWDATNTMFVLVTDLETLRNAPAFENNEYPDTREPGWDTLFREYWNERVPINTP